MPKVHRGSSKRKDANQAVYHVNTLCFARVRGYQPWPARIIEKKNGNKYQVRFFGTYDNATVAPDCIYPFSGENLKKYGGQRGSSLFKRAMEEVRSAPEVCDVDNQDVSNLESRNSDELLILSEDEKASDGIFYETKDEDPQPRTFALVKCDKNFVKDLMEEGVPLGQDERKILELKIEKSDEEKEQLRLALANDVFQEKMRFFTLETLLNELICNLKVCLSRRKPYLRQGLEILKSVAEIPFDSVMVKKVPELFSTIEQCSRYDGIHGIEDSQEELHRELVHQIRELADQLVIKVLKALRITKTPDHIRDVEKQIALFKNRTKHLTEVQRMLLTSENELRLN